MNDRAQRFVRVAIPLLSALGAILILLATSVNGAGVSSDSREYLAAAESLASGNGYVGTDGTAYVQWPPLLPTALAGAQALGLEPRTAARYGNALLFAALIGLSGGWLRRHLHAPPLVLLGTLAVLLSFPLVYAHVMVWSEPLFALLCVACCVTLDGYWKDGRLSRLWLPAGCAALACLQRYAGVTLVCAAVIALLVPRADQPAGRRMRHAALFAGIALGLLAVWFARNYHLTGTLAGVRPPAARPMPRMFLALLDLLVQWFVPFGTPYIAKLLIGLAVVVLLAVPGVLAVQARANPALRAEEGTRYLRATMMPVLFFWLHGALLVVTSARYWQDRINDRFMAAVFVPAIFVLFMGLDQVWAHVPLRQDGRPPRRWLIPACCALWLCYPAFRLTHTVAAHLHPGADGFEAAVVSIWDTPDS